MKKTIMTSMLVAISIAATAQTDNDSTSVAISDSVYHSLPEVMVKGQKPVVKVDGAKLVFDLKQLIKDKPADNAFDALKYLPGVTPNGEDINLSAMPVTLMINGKITSMTREQIIQLLKTTPAAKVENAEVMYSAPARYQVRGALINVVLTKDKSAATSLQGELFAKAEAKHEAHFNERASLSLHSGIATIDGYYTLTHGKNFYKMDKTGVHTLTDGKSYDIETREVIRVADHPVHNYRIGSDFDFGKNHQLSLSYTGSYEKSHQRNEMSGMQTSSVDNNMKTVLHNAHLDYTLPFGLDFGADATYYENNIDQNLSSNLMGNATDFISSSQQRINRYKLFLREEHSVGKNASINYGAVYTRVIDHSRQHYTPQNTTTADRLPSSVSTRRTEDTWNIYVGGKLKLDEKLSGEISLAAEHSKTTLWNEWDFYPTLTMTYQQSQNRLWQLSFDRDKTYPDFWAVQNITTYHGGQYEEIVGNPELKPSKATNISLTHVINNKYIIRGWFTHEKDRFVQTMFQSRDRLVEIDQFNNSDFYQTAGLMVAVPCNPAWWINSRATLFGVWSREKDSDYFNCPFDRNIVYGMLSANATLYFSQHRNFSLTLNGFARTKSYQATLDLPASGNLDINLRYAFAKGNAILNLYCNDIFQTMMITPECTWSGQQLRTEFSCYRTIGMSLTYRFGGYKSRNHKEVDMSRLKK